MASNCCSCSFQDTEFLANTCGPTFALFMSLIEFIIHKQCDMADPCNRLGQDGTLLPDNAEFDFIVVGAGVAGPVVASRLSENPAWKVLLIEAGPEEPTGTEIPSFAVSAVGTKLDWNYTTVPQKKACLASGGICKWPRGKMVSGTGGMQGMMYTRGHQNIFNNWERLGNEGWGYEGVLPYFIKAENNKDPLNMDKGYHGFDGPMTVQYFPYRPPFTDALVEAGQQLGYRRGDLNGRNQTGINIAQMMVHEGMRGSTPRMYLRTVTERTNLQVAINTIVTKVLINPLTKRAYGVEVRLKNGDSKTLYSKREVILTAGAVGSPQLLLLSGIGPKGDLEQLGIPVIQDLPVGRNLHNHVSVGISFYVNDTFYQALTLKSLSEFLKHRTGPLSSTGITQTTGFFKSKYVTDEVPDLQIFFDGFNASCSKTGLEQECNNGSMDFCGKRLIHARPTNINPLSVGYLKLKSADPLDHPIIDPQYLTIQRDVDVLVEGIKLAIAFTETDALKPWGAHLDTKPAEGCESIKFGSDAYWECLIRRHTGPENHQAGSCRMGPVGDDLAVVDPLLRVHGVSNIRVVDASVFPYVPNANPVSSIIMAAEKCSDMIKDYWEVKFDDRYILSQY